MAETAISRRFRDGRLGSIVGGADEIMLEIISKHCAEANPSGQISIAEAPKKPWKLESLADIAGMSRTRFAEHFRKLVGRTPIEYLTVWRMTIARQLLGKGKPVKVSQLRSVTTARPPSRACSAG